MDFAVCAATILELFVIVSLGRNHKMCVDFVSLYFRTLLAFYIWTWEKGLTDESHSSQLHLKFCSLGRLLYGCVYKSIGSSVLQIF